MRTLLILLLTTVISINPVKAQKFKKIFLNLYTDSLKKGTYNYINVDGQLQNGQYIPLDSTELKFWSSDGVFSGNNLFIKKDFDKEKVLIRITVKSQMEITKEFTMFIKKAPDAPLKTKEQIIKELKTERKTRKQKKDSLNSPKQIS